MFKNQILIIFLCVPVMEICAQSEKRIQNENEITVVKYSEKILGKMHRYESQLSNKTEKTLAKLSRWENKIRAILKKADPGSEVRLFGEGQQTFTSLLQQFKAGQQMVSGYESQYNAYLDTLKTSLKYLDAVKEHGIANTALEKANGEIPELEQYMAQASFTKEFIKQRKDLLIKEAGKYLKKKLVAKISKENYYYGQALDNYKEIFSDKTKVETLVKRSLNEIPAFKDFMRKNSMLASLFSIPGSNGGGGTSSITEGWKLGYQLRSGLHAAQPHLRCQWQPPEHDAKRTEDKRFVHY